MRLIVGGMQNNVAYNEKTKGEFMIHDEEKCKKCFLSPDICGAKNEETCDRIYDSKIAVNWACFKEIAGLVLSILIILTIFVFAYVGMDKIKDMPIPFSIVVIFMVGSICFILFIIKRLLYKKY